MFWIKAALVVTDATAVDDPTSPIGNDVTCVCALGFGPVLVAVTAVFAIMLGIIL